MSTQPKDKQASRARSCSNSRSLSIPEGRHRTSDPLFFFPGKSIDLGSTHAKGAIETTTTRKCISFFFRGQRAHFESRLGPNNHRYKVRLSRVTLILDTTAMAIRACHSSSCLSPLTPSGPGLMVRLRLRSGLTDPTVDTST